MSEKLEKQSEGSVIKRREEQPEYVIEHQKEKGKYPSLFPIWYIEPRIDSTLIKKETEKGRAEQVFKETKSYLSDREKLIQIERKRNEEAKKDRTKRPFYTKEMHLGDVFGEIKIAYEFPQNLECLPEMIIIRSDKEDIYGGGLGSDTALVKRIREEISKNLRAKKLEDKENLLQPIIIAVSDNRKVNDKLMEQGANLVMPDFKVEDINQLAQLTAKIKSDPASMAPEKVVEEKKKFYERVEGIKMEDRSKITADTEQELEMLRKIFEEHGVKKVLDVGCGDGRITKPLAEDKNLHIAGLEGNKKLIAKTLKDKKENADFIEGNLIDYTHHEKIPHNSKDAVIYTWHSILEAFGPGNTLRTLNGAWLTLKKDGILVFDQPTRENKDMADGWYYNKVDEGTEYLSYLMTEDEIKFILRISGFGEPEFIKWSTQPSKEYPEGMKKITVVVKKR